MEVEIQKIDGQGQQEMVAKVATIQEDVWKEVSRTKFYAWCERCGIDLQNEFRWQNRNHHE